jgi:hypothetical protein
MNLFAKLAMDDGMSSFFSVAYHSMDDSMSSFILFFKIINI